MKETFKNKKFGRLTALCQVKRIPNDEKHNHWICRCSCGTYSVVRSDNLLSGMTISCGCESRARGARRVPVEVGRNIEMVV